MPELDKLRKNLDRIDALTAVQVESGPNRETADRDIGDTIDAIAATAVLLAGKQRDPNITDSSSEELIGVIVENYTAIDGYIDDAIRATMQSSAARAGIAEEHAAMGLNTPPKAL